MAVSTVSCPDPGRRSNQEANEAEERPPHTSEDLAAFSAFTLKILPKLESVAFGLIKDKGTAHDIVAAVQDHMEKTKFHKFRKPKGNWQPILKAYLTTAVKRGCGKLRTAEARQDEWDDTRRPGGQGTLVVVEVPLDIHRCLGRLNEDDREMFLLKELDGLSIEELASMFGINEQAVKGRMFRARLKLSACMKKGGYRNSADAHMTRKEGR